MSEKSERAPLIPSTAKEPRWRGRLRFVPVGIVCAILATIALRRLQPCSLLFPPARTPPARELMKSSPLIDTHNDFPIFIRSEYANDIYQENFTSDAEMPLHVDFPRLRQSGLGAQFWSAYVECPKEDGNYSDEVYGEAVHDTLQQIDLIHRLVQEFPDHLIPAFSADDIRRNFARHPGRISSLIGIEGLHQIGNSASTLRLYHSLGVRYATLTHTCHNRFADSERPEEPLHGGLSAAGVDIVREMNRMGMIVDLSHTSVETQRDALNVTLAPVIFSHSNAYSLCKHTRNVPDDVLHLVKENDGVVMVTFLPEYVRDDGKQATLGDVADHIQYIGDLIGYRHVGIGSDFDGMASAPKGLEDVSKYPGLIDELLRRGLAVEDIKNLMGLNAIRVLEKVEKVAADLATRMKPLQDKVRPAV
ncbi:hypothetical protein VTO42DRAFT_7127 [Malbranchea cinnamomea]